MTRLFVSFFLLLLFRCGRLSRLHFCPFQMGAFGTVTLRPRLCFSPPSLDSAERVPMFFASLPYTPSLSLIFAGIDSEFCPCLPPLIGLSSRPILFNGRDLFCASRLPQSVFLSTFRSFAKSSPFYLEKYAWSGPFPQKLRPWHRS